MKKSKKLFVEYFMLVLLVGIISLLINTCVKTKKQNVVSGEIYSALCFNKYLTPYEVLSLREYYKGEIFSYNFNNETFVYYLDSPDTSKLVSNPSLSCKNTRDINESLDINKIAENRGIEQDTSVLDTTEHQITFKEIARSLQRKNRIITLNDLIEYETECLSDTIVARKLNESQTYYEEFYLINLSSHFKEMITLEELEKRGYKYEFRWVISTAPIEFEYYFVKEPTLKGFTKWLKNK